MNILHYSLGFPPYRTGGLTKYCIDIMQTQVNLGNTVSLLWPGRIRILNKNVNIKKKQNRTYKQINSYEIINPLPVPLLEGINRPEEYMNKCKKEIYEEFLNRIKPDIIHIHTLMGLHKEFLEVANSKDIKIVFTSHDYFGLCPKVNLFNFENCICDGMDNEKCTKCCINALGNKKVYILQSKFYRILKDFFLLKKIRQNVKHKQIKKTNNIKKKSINIDKTVEYRELKEYYRQMFEKVNVFHFNSKIAYEMYSKHIKISNYHILPITHMNIKDKRKKRTYDDKAKLSIGYIGAETYAKGYNTLREVLDDINKEGLKFELNVYFKSNEQIPNYINFNEAYNYSNIDKVFENLDVLIVPSNWKETFGFGVLEALSYSCPVICSKNVGASYIIKENNMGYVYDTEDELKEIIKKLCLSKDELRKWHNNIIKNTDLCMDMVKHTKSVLDMYN